MDCPLWMLSLSFWQFIDNLLPFLDAGDIIIDGGNSHFLDSLRRTEALEAKGFLFIGTGKPFLEIVHCTHMPMIPLCVRSRSGVSGGEHGALTGPSLMPGGSVAAWKIIKPIFQAISAHTDNEPCCDWVGGGGAGHYVKMVHNGIEYGDMQIICECYDLMRGPLGMTNTEISEVFHEWNKGDLDSFLVEITGTCSEGPSSHPFIQNTSYLRC